MNSEKGVLLQGGSGCGGGEGDIGMYFGVSAEADGTIGDAEGKIGRGGGCFGVIMRCFLYYFLYLYI